MTMAGERNLFFFPVNKKPMIDIVLASTTTTIITYFLFFFVETIFLPSLGEIAHANEHNISVALELTQISEIGHCKSFEVAVRRGIIPFFSASASNSAL